MRALAFVLTLVALILGPLSTAVRADPLAVGGEIVLCSDMGAITVAVDAHGVPLPQQPPPVVRHCDECLPLPQPAMTASPAASLAAPLGCAHPVWSDRTVAQLSAHPVLVPAARGPPTVTRCNS